MLRKLIEEGIGVLRSIDQKLGLLVALSHTQGKMTMAAIDDLIAQVAQNTSVESSAAQAIEGLSKEVAAAVAASAAAQDPKLQELTAKLAASSSALAAAITANTTPTPAPAPAPATPPTA